MEAPATYAAGSPGVANTPGPEALTCREYVVPRLIAAGWNDGKRSIAEQQTFTDGRITVRGTRATRGEKKRADYVLYYTPDFPLAVVEAKADYKLPADGLQQAKEYAEILGLKFAYATNGHGIAEHDYFTGLETELDGFPSADDLWARYRAGQGLSDEAVAQRVLAPSNITSGRQPRYYQQIAINRAVEAILKGQTRVLLTLATGTGKTEVAFQICWKLTQARWNRAGTPRKPRILYLADRNVLVDDPKDKTFAPFGEARWKIAGGRVVKSREMYFATYQAIAEDEHRPGLYRQYPPDFFDLVIVDECHRGSARRNSVWREILRHFQPACQVGMTATPKRTISRTTSNHVNIKHLRHVRLVAPPLSKQDAAVSRLSSLRQRLDHLALLHAETDAELDALLPSILDRAFKGEL